VAQQLQAMIITPAQQLQATISTTMKTASNIAQQLQLQAMR